MQASLSLRARLLVVLAVALLPLFAVAIWGALRDTNAAEELAEQQLKFSASLLASNQDRAIDTAEQLLGAITSAPQLSAMEHSRCRAYFENLRARYPIYTNIALFDTDGNPMCHSLGEQGASVRDRDYFREALAQQRFVMGEPVTGRVTGRRVLPFAMPVVDGGKVVAVAMAALDLEQAAHALAQVQLPPGAHVKVTDRQSHVLMQLPRDEEVPADASRIESVASSRLVGDHGIVVRVGLSQEQLARNAWRRGLEELAALAAVMVLAVAALWWVGGHMIVRPAKQILGTVRRIEQGRLDARVPMHATVIRGEFARIGAAFNLMADSLQTRQAELEAELGRSRSAYAVLDAVLNSMQEGLIVVTSNGKFLLHNRAAARLFPLADAPVLPELWPEHFGIHHADGATLYRADDLPLVRSALGESEGQSLVRVRNSLVPEGRLLQCTWHAVRGESVHGGLVMFTDVTELQQLQASQAANYVQLEEAQRKLIEAQRIGRIGNWELDLQTGRLDWSEQVFELFGIAREQFGGDLQSLEKLVHPDDRSLLKPARDRALLEGEVMEVEYRVVKPDGAIAWMREVGETRRNAAGEPVWYGGMVQDITHRKQIEMELQELNASLESRIAQRTEQLRASNAELEAFAYSVSHDLRAPLAAISGFSSALQEKVAGQADERVLHYISRIQAGVRKMEELIEALLQLSRVVRAEIESGEVDLSQMARETVETLQVRDPGRKVEARIEDGLVAHGDRRLLRIVLENLVGNAWKFTSKTDGAVIEVGRAGDDVFFVRDNGVGFDMAYADKLFVAFQRLHTESEFPGTGIGLATVRRVVTRHHGRVWVESQPGRGTVFYFSLAAA